MFVIQIKNGSSFFSHTVVVRELVLPLSSPEPKAHKVSIKYTIGQLSVVRRNPPSSSVHTFKNIISSNTTGPTEVTFYMEIQSLAETKVYVIGPGHITKMAAVPIYGKTLQKSSSPAPKVR